MTINAASTTTPLSLSASQRTDPGSGNDRRMLSERLDKMLIHVSLVIWLVVSSPSSPLLLRSPKYRANDRVTSPFWNDESENGGAEVEAIRSDVPFEEESQRDSQVENAYRCIR
jgi:hypothetical protein